MAWFSSFSFFKFCSKIDTFYSRAKTSISKVGISKARVTVLCSVICKLQDYYFIQNMTKYLKNTINKHTLPLPQPILSLYFCMIILSGIDRLSLMSISMLMIRDISVAAAHLAGIRICLEGEGLSGLQEGSRVGIHVELVEEDGGGEEQRALEVEVSREILRHDALVDRRKDGDWWPVPHELFESAVVWDVHSFYYYREMGGECCCSEEFSQNRWESLHFSVLRGQFVEGLGFRL